MERDKLPEWLKEQAGEFRMVPSEGLFTLMMRKRDQQRKQRKKLLWYTFSIFAGIGLGLGLWIYGTETTPSSLLTEKGISIEKNISAPIHSEAEQSGEIPKLNQDESKGSDVHSDYPFIAHKDSEHTTYATNLPATYRNKTEHILEKTPSWISANEQTAHIAQSPSHAADSISVIPIDTVLVVQNTPDTVLVTTVDSLQQTVSVMLPQAKHSYWSISGIFTPQLFHSLHNANSDASLSWMRKYLQNREQNDKAIYSFNAGIKVEKTFTKHWSLSTGVLYSMAKFEEIQLVSTVPIDSSVMESLTGSVNIKQAIAEKQNRFDISFSWLEIPLQVGYRINHKKMYYQFTTGVSCAYLFQTKSLVFNQTDSLNVHETNDAGSSRFNNYSLLVLAGINAGYDFSKRWSCYAGTVYRYSVNPLYSKEYSIRQQPYYLGLELGVKYSFR